MERCENSHRLYLSFVIRCQLELPTLNHHLRYNGIVDNRPFQLQTCGDLKFHRRVTQLMITPVIQHCGDPGW